MGVQDSGRGLVYCGVGGAPMLQDRRDFVKMLWAGGAAMAVGGGAAQVAIDEDDLFAAQRRGDGQVRRAGGLTLAWQRAGDQNDANRLVVG